MLATKSKRLEKVTHPINNLEKRGASAFITFYFGGLPTFCLPTLIKSHILLIRAIIIQQLRGIKDESQRANTRYVIYYAAMLY